MGRAVEVARSAWRSRVFVSLSRRGSRRWLGRLAAGTALALAASLLQAPFAAAPAHAAPRPAAPARPACPAQRPDETSAAIAAKLCRGRVEVTYRLSETTQVWANPDGTLTAERHLAPVRVRQGDRWVPVDLTLQKLPDGSVAPKAHPVGLRLSAAVAEAGEHELVSPDPSDTSSCSPGSGDRQIGLGWVGR